ncbi:MAG: HlyD family secretion protein, partial [Campylobacterota bacterium]
PLAKVADDSKALLTIYLDESDVLNAKKSAIYIDGEKTSYQISRLLNIADSKNISKYMAQIVIGTPKLFSKLVKVELKNE